MTEHTQTPAERALACKCPRCGTGDLYPSRFSLTFKNQCDSCGLDFSKNDAADGPAVFLIFILGFTIVPAALYVEFTYEPPVWVHFILWAPLVVLLTIGFLRPVKAYTLALQYKHRAGDLEE